MAAARGVSVAAAHARFRRRGDAIPAGPLPLRGPADSGGGIRFDRHELAGAFGDIGTDLPLLVGLIAAARLDPASVLTVYGVLQVLTGLRYRLPMPVQPLKAMAALVIAQHIPGQVLFGGGLAVGILVLALAATGAIDALARLVPKAVVRGVQFGLGLQLALLGLTNYVRADGWVGYGLALAAVVLVVTLTGHRRVPAALAVIALGAAYAVAFKIDLVSLWHGVGVRTPQFRIPALADVSTGLVLLALPQLPLSLANSILATRQVARDLFPDRVPTTRGIGLTYALMNLVSPFFGGVPTCHGSGGLAGHYRFGARTGGSVILYGGFYLAAGLLFSGGFQRLVAVFPLPILGVLLAFEGLALMLLARDLSASGEGLAVALAVGVIAAAVPFGYLIGLVMGTAFVRFGSRGLVRIAVEAPHWRERTTFTSHAQTAPAANTGLDPVR